MKEHEKVKKVTHCRASLGFYRLLGIPLLKKVIMGSVGKFVLCVNPREEMPSYFIGNPYRISSLLKTVRWSYFNEAVHLLLIVITAGIGYFLAMKGYGSSLFYIGMIILLNIGLVLLQHLNRSRIYRTISLLEKRKMQGNASTKLNK